MVNIKDTAGRAIWLLVLLTLAITFVWWGTIGGGMNGIVYAFFVGLTINVLLVWLKERLFRNNSDGVFTNRTIYMFLGLLALIVWMACYMCGSESRKRAFNDCVTNGEQLRVMLDDYYQAHKAYPETISALNTKLPCEIDLRPSFLPKSILTYKRTAQGYTLYFSDAFVSHIATQAQLFEAHK
jgi:hypothetical protein